MVLRIDSRRKLSKVSSDTQKTFRNSGCVVEVRIEQVILRRHLKVDAADKIRKRNVWKSIEIRAKTVADIFTTCGCFVEGVT